MEWIPFLGYGMALGEGLYHVIWGPTEEDGSQFDSKVWQGRMLDSTAYTGLAICTMGLSGLTGAEKIGKSAQNGSVNVSIDNIYKSANEMVRKGAEETKLVAAFRHHAMGKPELWGTIKGRPAEIGKMAQKALDAILEGPGGFKQVGNFLQKQLEDGRGIRLRNVDGQWIF